MTGLVQGATPPPDLCLHLAGVSSDVRDCRYSDARVLWNTEARWPSVQDRVYQPGPQVSIDRVRVATLL
jgi:hypothetical protein